MALGKKKEEAKKEVTYDIEVTRAKEIKGSYAFDMTVNGIKIYGCWIKEGKKGNFISFPSYKGSDDKYYSHVWFEISDALEKEIEEKVEAALK